MKQLIDKLKEDWRKKLTEFNRKSHLQLNIGLGHVSDATEKR